MKRRILFAGENEPLWSEFRTAACGTNEGWEAEFARTAPEATGLLDALTFDAVVADVDVSGLSGLELLDKVLSCQPEAQRIVLSDITDTRATLRCLGRGHHHLLKPCDTPTLLSALNHAIELEVWLPSQSVQSLIAKMRRVPSPPGIYFQVLAEMQSPGASIERVADLIAQDPAITAKVLQLANSAVFGLQLEVIQPVEAVIYIGLETTRSLVLMAHTFSAFDQLQLSGFSIDALWNHCLRTARFAREIARMEEADLDVAEQAFAAGLLHDLGKLLLAANLPEAFRQAIALAREQKRPVWEAESQVLGVCHAELGACLLGIWGLPAPIVEAVALHHFPLRCSKRAFSPLTAVHASDFITRQSEPPSTLIEAELDSDYLAGLKLSDHVEAWQLQDCLEHA